MNVGTNSPRSPDPEGQMTASSLAARDRNSHAFVTGICAKLTTTETNSDLDHCLEWARQSASARRHAIPQPAGLISTLAGRSLLRVVGFELDSDPALQLHARNADATSNPHDRQFPCAYQRVQLGSPDPEHFRCVIGFQEKRLCQISAPFLAASSDLVPRDSLHPR